MSEHFEDFVRKQFPVQAARVTPSNIAELAELCGGTLMHDGEKEGHFSRDYIKVRVVLPLNEEQTKARVGDWLVKQGRTFKVYKDPSFRKTFEQKDGSQAPGGNPPRKNNQNRKRKPKGKGPRQPQNGPANPQKPGNFVPRTPPSPANMPKKRTDVPQRGDTISYDESTMTATEAQQAARKLAEEEPLEITSPEAAAVQRHEQLERPVEKSPEELLIEQKIADGKVPLAEEQGQPEPEEVRPITLDELNGVNQDPGMFKQSPGERFRGEA